MLIFVYAQDENRGIGKDNAMPWHLPKELQHFKETTLGHTLVMGRRTFEAMDRRPLPGRRTIIVTRNSDYPVPEGVRLVHDLDPIRDLAEDQDVMVVGGANLLVQLWDEADAIIRTTIHGRFDCDTHVPDIDPQAFRRIEASYEPADAANPQAFTVEHWVRRD